MSVTGLLTKMSGCIILLYFVAEVYCNIMRRLASCLKRPFSCVEQDLFLLGINMDPIYVQSVQEVVKEGGGEPSEISNIPYYKVDAYKECLQKFDPYFADLKELDPLNWPRSKVVKILFCAFVGYRSKNANYCKEFSRNFRYSFVLLYRHYCISS
jgi:hypothetical protein